MFIVDPFPASVLVENGQYQQNWRIWLAELVILTYFRLAKWLESLPFSGQTAVAIANVRRIFIVDLFPAGQLVENGKNQQNLRMSLAELVILTYFLLANCLESLPFCSRTTVAIDNVRRIFIVDLFPAMKLVENGQNQQVNYGTCEFR